MRNHSFTPAEAGTLDLLTQPVFYAEGEQIVYRNCAAAILLPPEQAWIGLLMEEDALEAYRAYDGLLPMALTISLGGRPYGATVCRQGTHNVLVAQEAPLCAPPRPDTLTALSRAVRCSLNELFDAAEQMNTLLEPQENPKLQRQSARVQKQLYSLLRLATNLSDAGRYLAGEASGCFERMDLAEFLAGIHDSAAPLCATCRVTLDYQRPAQPFYVAADRQKLTRAVMNLISNALRFTPPDGRVTLSLDASASRAYLRVTDSGEGVSPEAAPTVFNRYEHPGTLPGDPRQRVGLGLPLVQSIAQLHGGTVVLAPAAGGGTAATISISRHLKPAPMEEVHCPVRNFNYAANCDSTRLELADDLPAKIFDPRDLG